jgi:SNF2 family DNA or RNA helicase
MELTGSLNSIRQPDIEVRDCRDPSVKGTTTGQFRSHAGRELAGVRLANGEIKFVPVEYLEPLPRHETRAQAFAARRTGSQNDLARHLLAEKISGRLTDVYYSMESGKAEFFPHQFRPILTFVESTIGRILVADEVGLGKTISAIYIWKELQARAAARRLLVVCPAVLRPKWRTELRERFSIEAKFVDATDLREELETTHRDTGHGFALIGGLEGLRSRHRTEDEPARRPRQKLMQWLQDNPSSSELSPFDLVIVDEAHAARNPNTANHHFIEALRDASAHLVLLTATPIQTHSENLFNLLKLVDPDRFVSADTFEQARRANISIIGAVNALQRVPADFEAFEQHLEQAIEEPLFRHDKALIELARNPRGDWDHATRVHTARMLESRSLLADVMVRTRKREAFKDRVQRVPWILDVTLSPEERQLYQKLSDRIRALAMETYEGTPVAFILIGRQRQLASSIPAALAAWRDNKYLDELLWDDLGIDLNTEVPAEGVDAVSIDDLLQGYDFEANDSKYKSFAEGLRELLKGEPTEKIVVFAYFRGTLSYLQRRLEADGIRCACIHGDMGQVTVGDEEMDAKTAEIERFAAPDGPSVLLSSEVGSEGIDLQFARILFNYDLPWNPMRVEQRIGRIDRIGQKAERITIGHFATSGTIDDRIVNRLYERINIFKESIGDLDEIFGERIQRIILDYFQNRLTPEQVEQRIEQNILAEQATKLATKQLDEAAPALAGHAEFILQSIHQSHAVGRYVRPDDLRRYTTDFLHEKYPGSSIEYDAGLPQLFRIDLSVEAREKLAAFIERERPARYTKILGGNLLATFDPNLAKTGRVRPEVIDVTHPLLLWMRSAKATEKSELEPAVAVAIDAAKTEVPPGPYVFATDLWKMEGIRRQTTLQHVVLSVRTGESLDSSLAERLIDTVCQHGRQIDLNEFGDTQETLNNALRACEQAISDAYFTEEAAFESENTNRVAQAQQLVEARADRKLEQMQATLERQRTLRDERQRRIIPLTESRIRRTHDEREHQLARIREQGTVRSSLRPIIGGVIVVSRER